jgi:hypothetical protein
LVRLSGLFRDFLEPLIPSPSSAFPSASRHAVLRRGKARPADRCSGSGGERVSFFREGGLCPAFAFHFQLLPPGIMVEKESVWSRNMRFAYDATTLEE